MTTLIPPSETAPYAIFTGAGSARAIPDADLIAAYKSYGAVLLRGFAMDLAGFRDLTDRLCTNAVFNESPSREVLDAERSIQTVNIGVEAFPLHPELSREPWKPDICFFWCMQPPTEGGETTVCDGVEIVRRLPPEVYDKFATRQLRYRQIATPAECKYWLGAEDPDDATLANPPPACPYSFERLNTKILRSFFMPAFHRPMFTDERAFGNFLLFGRYLNGIRVFPTFENDELVSDQLLGQVKAVTDKLETPVAWRESDVLILDNTRFMHGRRAVIDTVERRIATYFGYVRFAELDAKQRNAPWRNAAFRPPGVAAKAAS